MPSVNAVANGPAESPEAAAAAPPKTKTSPSPSPAAAATKGRGLRRWRRIRRDQERPRESTGGGGRGGGGGGGGGNAQLHKRWLPLAAAAAEAEAESSTASVESRLVPPPPPSPGPGPDLSFSVGAGNSEEDGSSRSSTAAAAPPRVPLPRCDRASVVLSPRERDRPWRRAAVSISTEAGCSRSSVESGLHSSNAAVNPPQQLGAAGLNGVGEIFSGCRGHGGDEQLSQEVRSTGRCRGNGSSVAGRSVRSSAGEEESVGNGGNGRAHSGADPCNESVLVLHRAQEALENEIEKIMAIGKEPSDEFDVSDDEWSGSVHVEEPDENLMVRIKHLESRLEEASALIKEKASRIFELEAIRSQVQPGKTTRESTNLLLSQCELDQLYQQRMESEMQCIILTKAYRHASATLVKDQMTLYQTQKSLSEDYKLLGLKLQHTENRAMVLEEMAEKLQLQCKELSSGSEVLQLRYMTSRVSLFCFVQFLLLCLAMGTYLMRLSPSSTKVVPT